MFHDPNNSFPEVFKLILLQEGVEDDDENDGDSEEDEEDDDEGEVKPKDEL